MSYKRSWVYFTCNKWVSTYLQLQINNHNEVFDVHATRSSYQTFKVNNGIPKYWIDNLTTTHNFCDAYAVTHVLAIYHQASTVDTIVPWAAGQSHTEHACKLTTCPLVSISVLLDFPGLFQVALLLSSPTRTFGNNWSSFLQDGHLAVARSTVWKHWRERNSNQSTDTNQEESPSGSIHSSSTNVTPIDVTPFAPVLQYE